MCSRDMLGDSYIILVPNGTGIWKPQPGSKKSQELFVKDGNGDFFKHFARFGIIQMKRKPSFNRCFRFQEWIKFYDILNVGKTNSFCGAFGFFEISHGIL